MVFPIKSYEEIRSLRCELRLILKQSVLDVSNRAEITTAADIELSRDEDSVQSVGNLATKDGLIVFAGINSSAKDQEAGKNEHLRSFDVKYPPRKKQKTEAGYQSEKGQWTLLGKRSLFKTHAGAKKETYQRALKLSPSQKRESASKRIGAIATGMARDSELIVFNATNPTPDKGDVLTRIQLDDRQEAADLDIAESEESIFSVAYCTDDGIHEQTFKYDFKSKRTEKTPKGPRRVYLISYSDSQENPNKRLKFRCLRFLNAQNIVALCNRPNKDGAELRVFHLYPTGPATMIQSKKLPSHVKQAVSLDVCALDADKDGNQQFVIAVAGQDISIEVFTTNYQSQTDTFSSFRSYLTLRDVHQHQMTKLCFSPFHSPLRAPGSEAKKVAEPKSQSISQVGTQYVQLASVSYGNTVVVDTFPLQTLEDSQKKNTRYVLSHPGDVAFARWTYAFIISIIVVVLAFLVQSFVGEFADDNTVSAPFGLLPKSVREFLDKPAAAAYGRDAEWVSSASSAISSSLPSNIPTSSEELKGRLQSLVDRHEIAPSDPSSPSDASSAPGPETRDQKEKTLIVRSAPEGLGGVTVDVHPDKQAYQEKDSEAKHWDELEEHQKAGWRERLKHAGQWVESEGEAVLKGILFSEYAGLVGAVGQGAADALREL